MAEKDFIVGSPVRVRGVLYRENQRLTCDPKDLVGVEHCVQPMAEIESKQEAKAKAAAEAEAEAKEAEAKAAAEEKAKAKAAGK